MNITHEQYDADIRSAKAQAIRDEAGKLDAWCGAQKVHAKDVSAELRNHADELEGK